MLFPSISFLFMFFPVFLLAFVLVPYRNLVILLFSLLFYIWGEGLYVILLLSTVLVNFLIGKMIHKNHACQRSARTWLGVGVVADLLILVYYKYSGFIVNSVMQFDVPEGSLPVLPLGISFFIFQSISYIVDVFRKDAKPASSLTDLALYVTMFPQLIAGPIVRFSTISDAIATRCIDIVCIQKGLILFVGGLAQKVLIANKAGQIADAAFGLPVEKVDTVVAWMGSAAYTLQIFFDFSGYSTMAIGIGLLMGFRFPENFNYPYIARSITEFWQRWHISLSRWFKDYLYIPLGGNRKGPVRIYANLFIVFIFCGFWHGAAWTFLAWGIYHGILLVFERIVFLRVLKRLPAILRHSYTLMAVLIGWIMFRAETFEQAAVFIRALFAFTSQDPLPEMIQVLTLENTGFSLLGVLFATPVLPAATNHLSFIFATGMFFRMERYVKPLCLYSSALIAFLFCCMYLFANSYNPFIYFRF